MAKVITIGLQKGGVGKSTTAGCLTYMLAQQGKKVLCVDMDAQANFTELFLFDPKTEEDFLNGVQLDRTILHALFEEGCTVEDVILPSPTVKNVDVLPSDDFLAMFADQLYNSEVSKKKFKGNKLQALKITLEPVMDKYDYIIIDTPPALSEQLTTSLVVSDYVILVAETARWAFIAIPNFLQTIEVAKEFNPKIRPLGIIRSLTDARRTDSKLYSEAMSDLYPELAFKNIVKRKAATGRLSSEGFGGNTEIKEALVHYKEVFKEVMEAMDNE